MSETGSPFQTRLCFDLERPQDRRFLGWVFNQCLYGEVTGIQCGHWIYEAPTLSAAAFLSRQATEEFSHVKRFARILRILDQPIERPATWIRFLTSGMMGNNWGEHVAIEMALGEGLVLEVFEYLRQTLPERASGGGNARGAEIRQLLESAMEEERRHVGFGERETVIWLQAHPRTRSSLAAQARLQTWVLSRLRNLVARRVAVQLGADHPVATEFPKFFEYLVGVQRERIRRIGLGQTGHNIMLTLGTYIFYSIFEKLKSVLRIRATPRLTQSYLNDPWILGRGDSGKESEREA